MKPSKKHIRKRSEQKKGPLLPEDASLLLNPKEQFCNERTFLKMDSTITIKLIATIGTVFDANKRPPEVIKF
jgi:hypothetical protein